MLALIRTPPQKVLPSVRLTMYGNSPIVAVVPPTIEMPTLPSSSGRAAAIETAGTRSEATTERALTIVSLGMGRWLELIVEERVLM